MSEQKVQIEVAAMSQCPDVTVVWDRFSPAFGKLQQIADVKVRFLGRMENGSPWCKHGEPECIGNAQALCVQRTSSFSIMSRFFKCQLKDMQNIPNNGRRCASEASVEPDFVDMCGKVGSRSPGYKLLEESFDRVNQLGVTRSCTVMIDGKQWCQVG